MSAPDYAEIVRSLRVDAAMNSEIPVKTHLTQTARLESEAAAAIESLAARVAELEQLVYDLAPEGRTAITEPFYARITALEAERDAIVKELDETRERHLREARAADEARDDFEGLRAERDALWAYADHSRRCEYALGIGGQFNRCTCGFDAARARWAKERT